MNILITYFITVVIFLVIDAIWLGIVATNFYASQLGDMILDKPKLGIAFVFYCFYVVGIVVFALQPALASGIWWHALAYGALFGFIAYGTYDLTNMATLKNWPVMMSVVDMIWGTVLTGTTSVAAFFAVRMITGVS